MPNIQLITLNLDGSHTTREYGVTNFFRIGEEVILDGLHYDVYRVVHDIDNKQTFIYCTLQE